MSIREPIDVALFSLIWNHPLVAGQFVSGGRFLKFFDEVPDGELPALFLRQKGEQWVKKGKGIPAIRSLQRELALYALTNEPTATYPSSLCNAMMDVIDQVIEQPGNPGNVQTLGGLCEHVYLEGEVVVDEGLVQGRSIMIVPLTIMLP